MALLAAVLTVAACSRGGGDDKAPEPGDRPVARVQDETVWASDVKREAVAQGLIGEGEPLDASSELFRRVLDEVVDQKLLASEALERKLDKDPVAQRRLAAAGRPETPGRRPSRRGRDVCAQARPRPVRRLHAERAPRLLAER